MKGRRGGFRCARVITGETKAGNESRLRAASVRRDEGSEAERKGFFFFFFNMVGRWDGGRGEEIWGGGGGGGRREGGRGR